MLWLVLLCVVTVGTSTHSSDDVTWLPLPQLPSSPVSAENGSSYTERLVHHWHHRLRNSSHRPSHRPLSPDNKYHAWHSRPRYPTHRPPRTSSSPDDDNNNHNNTTHNSNRPVSPDNKYHASYPTHTTDNNPTHRPPRAPSMPSNRRDSHYVNDVDLFATFLKEKTSNQPKPLMKSHRDGETVYKAWPGETQVDSLDDLILYHTYTSEGGPKPNNFQLDTATTTSTPSPPKPAQEYLDALLVHHDIQNPSTTSPPSSNVDTEGETQYDLIAQEPHKSDGSLKPPATADGTKVSLDDLILFHTQTTDDNPRPSRPVGTQHPGYHHVGSGNTKRPIGAPTKWDHHYHKPPRPSVILIEDVKPPYADHGGHYPPRPGYRPPPPQTVHTHLTHLAPFPSTTQSAASIEASQIVVIHNNYPPQVTSTARPHYTTQRPHYTVNPYPVPYPDDFTTRRPLTVHTTHRPPYVTVTTPQFHYTTHRPPHVPSSTTQSHYNTHRPTSPRPPYNSHAPHVTVTTPQSHYTTHRPNHVPSSTPPPPYSSQSPPYYTVTVPQSHYTTHRPIHVSSSTPHPPYSSQPPPYYTISQSHYNTHRPTHVSSTTPHPPHVPPTTPQYDYNLHRPTYVTATTPRPPYNTHRPSYITVTTPQSHYNTHGPSYVTVNAPHYTSHQPTYVSTTTSPPYYPPNKPTYVTTTTPKPHYPSPRPPYPSMATPPHTPYPSHSEKPPQVYVVCPNITITSTINNYNAYTNATKEGCADINIVINNENLLIKDPTFQSPTEIQGEPFPPQGDDPGDSGESPEDSGEGSLETYPPVVNRPWQPWDMFGIKGPLLDVLELLTIFWSSLPTNIMMLLIVVGTIKKFALGLGIALALWKHKEKKMKKKSMEGMMEVHNTHLHLQGVKGISEMKDSGHTHYHKVRRKYGHKRKDNVDEIEDARDEYERDRDETLSGGMYENHREEYGDLEDDSYENHREVYGDVPLRTGYKNHREDYLDPRAAGRDGYTRVEDYDDTLGGIRDGYGRYSEDEGEGEEFDSLAGGRRMGRAKEDEMEVLDQLEDYVKGLIEAFKMMPDEGGEYDFLAGGRRMGRAKGEEMEALDQLEEYVKGLIETFKMMPDEEGV